WKAEHGVLSRSPTMIGEDPLMYRVKQLFGGSLTLRDYDGQVAEALTMVRALNKMTKAGMPESVRIA
ncbi:IS5/IS1182 family transposase, partial [Klebsiella variicola]